MIWIVLFLLTTSCHAKDTLTLSEKGKIVYQVNCTSCHSANPNFDSFGPPLFGSSKELLEAKVINGRYPAGYKPKRDSRSMPLLPWLHRDIDALEAYLNEGKKCQSKKFCKIK